MPDQLVILQASNQEGDWMSAIGRPVSIPLTNPPFPPGSHYALHQAAPPAAQTANPPAATSPYHSNQSYLPQSQVECLSSCPLPSCQLTPFIMFPCVQHLLVTKSHKKRFKTTRCQPSPGKRLESCWHTYKSMRPATV